MSKRVLVLNNYPFEQVWQEVKRGEKPDHHLYGINYFHTRGYEVELVPFTSSQFLQQVGQLYRRSRLPIPLGNFDQQWSCWQQLNQADLIYCPCQTQTHLLNYLRAIGLIKIPIVCIAHHPLNYGKLAKLRQPFFELLVKGTDAFPSLSSVVAAEINQLAHSDRKSGYLSWGPDANYYQASDPASDRVGEGVIAAGRTGRDFQTFGQAASQTNAKAQIICLESGYNDTLQGFSQNVSVMALPDHNYMKYPQLLQLYAQARILAIPVVVTQSIAGLTSLMDALGMGKPVIMTKHPLIDLDIEALGVGKWVAPGDVEGWRSAIQFFEDDPDAALEMGHRARQLVEQGFNSEVFSQQVMDIFDRLFASAT
ncbi:glycosyl transferase group 1 [Thalassoporum mexicanum PCC 7367]|uniref:glycosyltransferase n=1 Tax=Thalassoporum mexicanum TaxID=3457544 RepID=UPI00029FB7BF|nr:glycosyltransferase [Pseudanabaena sp. PCC 7367]AFY71853.1 glycosyl transferase group 1 [Pseudanabaena sp. PCC 7367]